jgi:hypothetical protein
MSALGQKQTCAVQLAMSALPPIADIRDAKGNVRFVPCSARVMYALPPIADIEWDNRNLLPFI